MERTGALLYAEICIQFRQNRKRSLFVLRFAHSAGLCFFFNLQQEMINVGQQQYYPFAETDRCISFIRENSAYLPMQACLFKARQRVHPKDKSWGYDNAMQ